MRIIIAIYFSLILPNLLAQSPRILLDESYNDWDNISPAINDASGDVGTGFVDFRRLWISHDEQHLFLRFEVGAEINLQDGNEIHLYLDTDNNNNTGQAVGGIGAELMYHFGGREGSISLNGNTLAIGHADIGLVSSPTVTSAQFELAIRRDVSFLGQTLFNGNDLRVVLRNEVSGGDQLPDFGGGIDYQFGPLNLEPLPDYSIDKPSPDLLRVMSYNVLNDDLFDPSKSGNYTRILQATRPDIIGFQEIYSFSSAQTANKVNSILPLITGLWYHARVEPDIIAVSKYPILGSHEIAPGGNGAFLLDLGPQQLLLIVAHPPCCSNNDGRQAEIDGIMAFIRDAKDGLGPLTLPPNSPIIVLGDMNLVGLNQQQLTLLNGDIQDENTYGPDFDPDWDGSGLDDAKAFATGTPFTMTWYREASAFSPGRLDYITYSGSILSLENQYNLFTRGLSAAELTQYNLQSDDAIIASDHLPLIADFSVETSTSISTPTSEDQFALRLFPNPAQDQLQVSYSLPQTSEVQIKIVNLAGQEVLSQQILTARSGDHRLDLDISDLPAGLYSIELRDDQGSRTQRWLKQ